MAAKQNPVTLSVDPGTTQSAYVMMRADYSIISAAKVDNEELRQLIMMGGADELAIECMEPRHLQNGMIGEETYGTCYWIGRYMECAQRLGMPVHRIYRVEERSRIIPSKKNRLPALPAWAGKSADAQIRAALIQRFARHDKKNGKGTSKCKDVFYGFAKDVWNAYAVGVVHLDKRAEEARKAALGG